MSSAAKRLDAVERMRAARDVLSMEIAGMTLDQELQWLAAQDLQDPFLKRLRDRAVRTDKAVARSATGT
jgi:hypothetical protein